MASRRLLNLRPLSRSLAPPLSLRSRTPFVATRHASTDQLDPSITDPNMNGGYINPAPGKRALRDPYGDWWDKQERRNFGEPVHEDNDIYAIFSTEPYTHKKPGEAAFHMLCFIAAFAGLCGVVYQVYPDRVSTPRTYEGGLDRELGGKEALLALQEEQL